MSETYYKITSQGSDKDGQRKAFSNPTHPSKGDGCGGGTRKLQRPELSVPKGNPESLHLLPVLTLDISHESRLLMVESLITLCSSSRISVASICCIPVIIPSYQPSSHRKGGRTPMKWVVSVLPNRSRATFGTQLILLPLSHLRQYRDGY